MAANHQQTYTMPVGIRTLCNIIRSKAFADKLRTDLKSENPTPTGVWYRIHHGASFTSWGEKITITLTVLGPETTQVHIHSECGLPTQIIDWGKNKQIVCNVYEYLEANMRMPQYQEPSAPQTPVQPAPAQNATVPCPQCGAQVPSQANFCQGCGFRMH